MNRVKNSRGRNLRRGESQHNAVVQSRRVWEQVGPRTISSHLSHAHVEVEVVEAVVQVEAEEAVLLVPQGLPQPHPQPRFLPQPRFPFFDMPILVKAAIVLDDDKGEDPDFLFVSDPPPDYLCQICTKVLREPHVTECCGQHFCKACLEKWFSKSQKNKKVCPHCREVNFVHIVYKPLQRKINELKVFCSNCEKGCEVTLKLEELEAHLSITNPTGCGHVSILCSNGCHRSILRSNLDHHMKEECVRREVTCCHCDNKMTYEILADHYEVCEEMLVSCPRDCGMQFRRGDMKKHEDECPNMQVKCPFFEAGCRIELMRKELDEHMEKGTTAHLCNLLAGYNALKADVESFKGLKSQIAVEVARIKDVIGQPNSETSKSLECIESSLRSFCLKNFKDTITFSLPPNVNSWQSPSFTVSPACVLSLRMKLGDTIKVRVNGNLGNKLELVNGGQCIKVSLYDKTEAPAPKRGRYSRSDPAVNVIFSHTFTVDLDLVLCGCKFRESLYRDDPFSELTHISIQLLKESECKKKKKKKRRED